MSLCQSIDTLAMAFLDDELVVEERRELELHLLTCATCRHHVDSERAELQLVRKALVAPPAPDLLKARLAGVLDREDRDAARAGRRRSLAFVGQWLLPGAATLVAAAAILMFVMVRPPDPAAVGSVTQDAVRQQTRSMPLEVQGASTGPWLREHFAPVEPPQFTEPGIDLVGARLTSVAGHEAALLKYRVSIGTNQFTLTAVLIDGMRRDGLSGGQAIKVGDRTLHVHNANGTPAITYVDEHGMGYTFAAERLSPQELLELVVSSDLIGRAQQGR
ncbi:MAG: zf-HC2 domain-containing protein [Myxococcota bacterium]|nr:zf-HC2 domain-containing protein [Myxococcota bacterium]